MRRALTDSGGLGRPRQRPTLHEHPIDQQLASLDAETSVSVQLHPVSSLGLVASTPTSLQGGPDEQRAQVLQLGEVVLSIGYEYTRRVLQPCPARESLINS